MEQEHLRLRINYEILLGLIKVEPDLEKQIYKINTKIAQSSKY